MGTEIASLFARVGADTGDAERGLGRVGGLLSNLGGVAQSALGVFTGQLMRDAVRGIASLGSEALNSYAEYERLGMSLEALVAREMAAGEVVEQVSTTRRTLTEAERAKVEDLQFSYTELANKLTLQKERLAEATAKGKESAAELEARQIAIQKTERSMADLTGQISSIQAADGALISVVTQVTEGGMSMADALAQAGPKAQELLEWIQKLAIKSPFTQTGVSTAYKTAMAYGFTADESKRLTTSLIDFASATGQTESVMSQVALALGQIKAKGKLAGQEVLQLTNAGVDVRNILAKAFGVTTAQLVEMQEQGLIPAEDAIEAIIASFEKDWGGAAERQSETFSGLLSSLKDIKEIGLREFFSGTFKAVQPYVAEFVGTLSSTETMGRLRSLGEVLGKGVIGGIQTLIRIGGKAKDRLSGILDAASEARWLPAPLREVSSALSGAISGTVSWSDAWGQIGDVWARIKPTLKIAAETMQSLLSGSESSAVNLSKLLNAMGVPTEDAVKWGGILHDVALGIGEILTSRAPEAWAELGVPQSVIDSIGSALDAFGSLKGKISDYIAAIGEGDWKGLWEGTQGIDEMGRYVETPGLKADLQQLGRNMVAWVGEGLTDLARLAVKWTGAWDKWINLETTQTAIADAGETAGYKLADAVAKAIESVVSQSSVSDSIGSLMGQAVANVQDIIISAGATFTGHFIGGIVGRFTDPATAAEVGNAIATFLTNIAPYLSPYTGLLKILEGAKGLGTDIGTSIGESLYGLRSSTDPSHVNISGGIPGAGMIGYAAGTSYHPGGWAVVGERGPELLNLPRGSQVYPSVPMGNSTTINIGQILIPSTNPTKAGDSVVGKLHALGAA